MDVVILLLCDSMLAEEGGISLVLPLGVLHRHPCFFNRCVCDADTCIRYMDGRTCSLGAEVRIKVDAVPDTTFTGTVERISDATGSAFSLIPIDNATGNFVKVEQRVTIRIRLNASHPADLHLLKAGYNVACEVQY